MRLCGSSGEFLMPSAIIEGKASERKCLIGAGVHHWHECRLLAQKMLPDRPAMGGFDGSHPKSPSITLNANQWARFDHELAKNQTEGNGKISELQRQFESAGRMGQMCRQNGRFVHPKVNSQNVRKIVFDFSNVKSERSSSETQWNSLCARALSRFHCIANRESTTVPATVEATTQSNNNKKKPTKVKETKSTKHKI